MCKRVKRSVGTLLAVIITLVGYFFVRFPTDPHIHTAGSICILALFAILWLLTKKSQLEDTEDPDQEESS